MKNTNLAYLCFEDENISIRIAKTPAGDMVVAGDENSLKACSFLSSLGAPVRKRGSATGPVFAALEFFTCYNKDPQCGIDAYFKKGLVLDMGTFSENQKKVYSNLIKIKAGSTISYGELALISGIPGGGRFVGNTMAANRFPVIIPCHRVIQAGRVLGRYGSDDKKKSLLLEHEGLHVKNKRLELQ